MTSSIGSQADERTADPLSVPDDRHRSPLDEPSIHEVVRRAELATVFQPIVDLDTAGVVAVEALTRGPAGTRLERPDQLFQRARETGLEAQLDWQCRADAVRTALAAELGRWAPLFLNSEPVSLNTDPPRLLEPLFARAKAELQMVIEITERDLLTDPAALIREVDKLRADGYAIAVDDLGADPASLSLLPFLRPDIIKLDLGLVKDFGTPEIAAISAAVRSDAERRGAIILAEGIETREHLDRALVMGATLGQGWFFGRPGALEDINFADNTLWSRLPDPAKQRTGAETPWELVAGSDAVRVSTKRLLLPMSLHLEQRATSMSDMPVVLTAFQHARNFTPATARRYADLAPSCGFIAALGVGLGARPIPEVRGGSIPTGHPLAGEWAVVVLGPHESAALIAQDLGDQGPELDRRFSYVVTHDRDTVLAAARPLMALVDQTEEALLRPSQC